MKKRTLKTILGWLILSLIIPLMLASLVTITQEPLPWFKDYNIYLQCLLAGYTFNMIISLFIILIIISAELISN